MNFSNKMKMIAWVGLLCVIPCIGDTPAVADRPVNLNPAGIASTFLPDVNLSADDLAAILGVYVWKFELTLPDGHYQVGVQVLKAGKHGSPTQIGSELIVPVAGAVASNHVLIALVPVDGTIAEASKVRVVIAGLGGFAAMTIDNPVEGMSIGLPQQPEKPNDLTYVLLGGFRWHNNVTSPLTGNADRLILVNFQTQMIQPDNANQ
jgi:hypothetical protein